MIKNVKECKDNDFDIKRAAEEVRKLSFDDHVCIGCGICESTCPVEAIELKDVGAISRVHLNTQFSGHDKIKQNIIEDIDAPKIDIDEDKCVLCGMCSGLCPADALKLEIDGVSIKDIDSYPHYNHFAEIDDDECIYCQKCQVACPREAITIERHLPKRSDLVTGEISVNEDKCIYCGVCEEMCPAEAIVVDEKSGEESIVIDKDKCVYCLVCKKVCPKNAIDAVCRICSYGDYDLDPADAVVTGSSIIEQDHCVKCGWCEGVCPTTAAKTKKAFTGTLDIDQDKCKSCGACVDICPCNVLSFPIPTGPGQILDNIVKKDEYCIRCGACEKACPNDAITVKINSVDHTPTNSKTWIKALDALKN
ncbi:tungsten-dependent formylmethanofuran dehydrogenase subunit FwdF [Methanobrevibacter sp. DSM 116169]|uniref:tungsten-dependent formylmethanofuran dehydrogenase subunit FwdF n=1 Tax=Methanobrevibacter sp. DSM 116169 TaxID=3242727 RepID=UPI0038FCD3B7